MKKQKKNSSLSKIKILIKIKKMGAAKSKNVAESTMQALTTVATNIIQGTNLKSGQAQIISVVGNQGPLDIKGNEQTLNVQVDLNGLMKAIASSESQTDLTNQLDQLAKSLLSGINFLQFPYAQNITKNYMQVVTDISTNIQQSCAAEAKQTQVISVVQRDGVVRIINNKQKAVANLFATCVQDAIVNNQSVIDMQNLVKQVADAQAQGLSEWALVLLAFFALLALILPIVLPIAIGMSSIMKNLITIFATLIVIAGIVLIILYYTSQETTIRIIPFSRTIEKVAECFGVKLPNNQIFDDPVTAGDACLKNDQCQGFDWIKVKANQPSNQQECDPTNKKRFFMAGCEEKTCDNPNQEKRAAYQGLDKDYVKNLAFNDYRSNIDSCGFGMTCSQSGAFGINVNCKGIFDKYYVTVCEDKDFKNCDPDADPNDPPVQGTTKTTFYSSVLNPCSALENRQDTSPRLIQKRVFLQGNLDPTGNATEGTVYINVKTGRYWVYAGTDGWVGPQNAGFDGLSGAQKLIIATGPPVKSEDLNVGDIAIGTANPKTLQLYRFNGSEWKADPTTIPGPGYLVDVPDTVTTSGFKYTKKNTWMLWTGITCLVIGILMLILFFVLGVKYAKQNSSKN